MRLQLPPVREVQQVAAPVTFEVVTGNRSLISLEPPDDGSAQMTAWRERTIVSIDERTGLVAIESPYGTFSYYWPPAYRRDDIFTFLAGLDFDYFMNKAAKQPYREINLEKTLLRLRTDLIAERRRGDMDKIPARDRWDALSRIEAEHPRDDRDFVRVFWDDSDLYEWWGGDVPPIVARDTGSARQFWDVVWQTLIASVDYRYHMVLAKVAA